MSLSINDIIPKDILDILERSKQTETLSYFKDGTFTQDDVNGFINQVIRILTTFTCSAVAWISPTPELCI